MKLLAVFLWTKAVRAEVHTSGSCMVFDLSELRDIYELCSEITEPVWESHRKGFSWGSLSIERSLCERIHCSCGCIVSTMNCARNNHHNEPDLWATVVPGLL